jgi:hypothetical protein
LCCHWFLENQWAAPNKKMQPFKKFLKNYLCDIVWKNCR